MAKDNAVKIPDSPAGKAYSTLRTMMEKKLETSRTLVTKGDSQAMRAVISVEGDLDVMDRIGKRFTAGFYA